jgi:tRNA nucleotidyltransferase (CCA-adding enzyme)
MIDCPQDPEWHPEGDVFTHTGHALDALVEMPEWREAERDSRIVWSFAVLLHDSGKPASTREEMRATGRRIVSPGHESAGVPLARTFLERIGAPESVIARVLPLVDCHMAHLAAVTDRSVRRLARRLDPATIQELAVLVLADGSGRPPKPPMEPAALTELLDAAERLRVADAAPRPILLGRHLIERGWAPGPEFKPALDAAFEAQLEGDFGDIEGALRWFGEHEGEFKPQRQG